MMNNLILGLLAETFIHSGIGCNEGAIDLPAAREAATDYPYIPGSSLKGALRDYARTYWKRDDAEKSSDAEKNKNKKNGKVGKCFGKEGAEQAGGILISDARLLLLPVRSLTGAYKWATCPLLLERLGRDMERSRCSIDTGTIPAPGDGTYIGKSEGNEGPLYLEERTFSHHSELSVTGLVNAISKFMAHDSTRARLPDQLTILSNKDFNWFARYALSVQARNVLEPGTKKSKNLWYEESLPPDTLMYTVLGERTADSGLPDLRKLIGEHPYLQTGGNETIGMGWFALARVPGSEQTAENAGDGA